MDSNSNISATVKHTKIAQEPDTLNIRPLFNEQLPDCFWSGYKYPFLARPSKGEVPVFYTDATNLTLSSPIITSGIEIVEELLTNNWSKSVDPCSQLPTGCFVGDLSVFLDESPPIITTDDCGCLKEIPTAREVEESFTFSMDYNGGVLTTTIEACVRADEDPFPTQFIGAEESLLPKMDQFDVQDYFGNGMMFSNTNSATSLLLNRIFSDEFTNTIQEKISQFGPNTKDIDLSDIFSSSQIGEMLGLESNKFLDNSPSEIVDLVKLGSLKYEDLFGFMDVYSKYSPNNIGELLSPTSTVTVGERLFYQKTTQPRSQIQILVVPPVESSSLTIDETLIVEGVDYLLSDMKADCIDPVEFCFWRLDQDFEERVCQKIATDCLESIPDLETWGDLIEKKIQRNLLNQL